MSSKGISKSTLGLRFMQMAARSKQAEEVEVDKAAVKDDGYWEVEKDVRDAWGIGSSGLSQTTIDYETSYLPFLYPSSSYGSDKPRGRRTFNKHGEEELRKESTSDTPWATKEPGPAIVVIPSEDDPKLAPKGPKVHPRPKPISTASGHLFGFPQQPLAKSTKTAKELIYDNTGVGTDLRESRAVKAESGVRLMMTPGEFRRPAGVDDPLKSRLSSLRLGSGAKGEEADVIIPGDRKKKVKREHSDMEHTGGAGTKPKKSRKNTG